jgi:hypothetical protein
MSVGKSWFEVKHYIGGEFVNGKSSFEVFYLSTIQVIETETEGNSLRRPRTYA